MEMHQVRYFLAVVKYFNFTRAAEDLRISQPSLTRAIQKLEAELEGSLFRRERSNTHLTELGRLMLPHLQAAYGAAESARSQARRLKARQIGSLMLGLSTGIEVNGILTLVLEAARKIAAVDLSVDVEWADTVERRLTSGEFDAAVMAPVTEAHDRFDFHLIHDDDLVVACTPEHRFASRDAVALDDLDNEPLVARARSLHEDALASMMRARGLKRNVRHRSNDPRWIAGLVRGGLGCAVLPKSSAAAHGLVFRPLDKVPLRHRTMLATVAGRRHSVALAALVRQVTKAPRA